jgi:RNA polymerase sigma-70 factor, ECF subfamily
MQETELIEAASKGDLDSFNHLVLQYQNLLYTQAYRMMGESDSAEDLTQEAFIIAYRKLHTFRGGSFKAWLIRIATNLCYDELRRYKRRPIIALEPLDQNQEEVESPNWLTDPGESPEEAVERQELANAIQDCLNQLSPDYKAVVVLVDFQEMDYSEAAQVVGSPLGTIKSRLARARTHLKDCLLGVWELLPASLRLMRESEL